jgi:glutamate racemase
MARFAQGVEVLEDPCRGLVPLIEAGQISAQETKQLLRSILRPMFAFGVDTLVLGCTHYPFIQPVIESIIESDAGNRPVAIIDPAPAVARQTAAVLARMQMRAPAAQEGSLHFFSSARTTTLAELGEKLLGHPLVVHGVIWREAKLVSA